MWPLRQCVPDLLDVRPDASYRTAGCRCFETTERAHRAEWTLGAAMLRRHALASMLGSTVPCEHAYRVEQYVKHELLPESGATFIVPQLALAHTLDRNMVNDSFRTTVKLERRMLLGPA